MISRRILINLAAFGALFVLLCFWAVRNIIRFEFIERPYHVSAEFDTSPGLRPDFEVTYLGVRVGNISSVKLVDDRVVVGLAIDRGTEVPAGVSAAVRRKSAVGEPYVDLSPPEGVNAESVADADRLEGGDVIPLERTSIPLSYGELFAALDDLVSAVPPADLDTLIHELAVGLEGRSEAIRRLLEGASDLTGTFASRDELLDQLTDDLTRLTHTFAEHREAFGSAVDDLALIADTLAGSRADLVSLLEGGPGFTDRVASLFAETEGDLGCTLDALGAVAAGLAEPGTLSNLAAVLERAADTTAVVEDVIVHPGEDGATGPYIDAGFSINGAVPPSPDKPPPLNDPAGRRACNQAGNGALDFGGDELGQGQGEGVGAGEGRSDAPDTDRQEPGEIGEGASSDKDVGGGGFDLGKLVVPLLILLAVALLAARPWRYLPMLGKRGDQATDPAAPDEGDADATTELEAQHESEEQRT